MSARSKILTMLPKRLRDQLDQKLREGAFSDYAGIAAWLNQQGFAISRSALQRYGSNYEQKVRAIALATDQAHRIALTAPDRENAMTDALTRLVQERIFGLLVETEDISERDLPRLARAIADLARASISQKRWAEEIAARLDEQRRAAERSVAEMVTAQGLSPAAAARIREILMGIDPLAANANG